MDVLPATWLVKRIKRLLNKSSTSCTLYSIWCNNRTIMNTCKAGQRKFTDRIDRWSVQVYCLDVLTNAYSLWVILTLSIINRVCNESPPATSPDKRWKLFVFYFSRTWFMSWKEAWWVAHVFNMLHGTTYMRVTRVWNRVIGWIPSPHCFTTVHHYCLNEGKKNFPKQ